MEKAYKITTREELKRFNERFGLNESQFPALYLDVNGDMTHMELRREEFLRSIGYDILTV